MSVLSKKFDQFKSAIETGNADTATINDIIEALDEGKLRVAEKKQGKWVVNEWIKEAIVRYFGVTHMESIDCLPFHFRDKIPLKKDIGQLRIVPGGNSIRFGAHLEPQVVMMPPSFVNIGARVGRGSMIDSNVLVGSCAQIGSDVHLSAGVQIGGVLEPANARPVILEDRVFTGAGAIIVEGILIRASAIIAPGVVLSAGTRILEVDAQGKIIRTHQGEIPSGAIVVPGARMRGEVMLQTPVIIGYREEKTDAKVALSQFLRQF